MRNLNSERVDKSYGKLNRIVRNIRALSTLSKDINNQDELTSLAH